MKLTNKQLAQMFLRSIESATEKEMDATCTAFIQWMHDRGELKRLKDVMRSIDVIWKETYGAANVTIESAHPLTKTLKDSLVKMTHGADIKEIIDESLIGGARVRVDDRLIDGSLKGALTQLKVTLTK